MDKRHSSPSPRATLSPRPKAHRKRSNSLSIVEALGCSTPEAELILAEGKAAVRRRFASIPRRGRRWPPEHEESTGYHPQDHLRYLEEDVNTEPEADSPEDVESKVPDHSRRPSDATDRSSDTITPTAPTDVSEAANSPASPLWDYSSNLAKFIQTQLNSMSAYNPMAYLRSFPDLSQPSMTPRSPPRTERRAVATPGVIEIPPIRPPLSSAFSEWSSADEGTEDEASPFASARQPKSSRSSNFTPSAILRFYEHHAGSSFLFTTTPLEEDQQGRRTTDRTMSPSAGHVHDAKKQYETDYPSSPLSTHPQLTCSSAPSLSSTSTASYFEYRRTKSRTPLAGGRNLTAISPHRMDEKVVPAISPFEGAAISNVHDIIVESRNRIRVDGMTFDLVQASNLANGLLGASPGLHTAY